MNTIEERFALALHNCARSWRQALDRRLRDLGLGMAGWMAIAAIARAPEPCSQTALAHKLAVEDPTMVAMLDRLVRAGYVRRAPSATDRRVKQVLLTEAGRAIYDTVRAEAEAFRAQALRGIDPARLAEAAALLEALHDVNEAAP